MNVFLLKDTRIALNNRSSVPVIVDRQSFFDYCSRYLAFVVLRPYFAMVGRNQPTWRLNEGTEILEERPEKRRKSCSNFYCPKAMRLPPSSPGISSLYARTCTTTPCSTVFRTCSRPGSRFTSIWRANACARNCRRPIDFPGNLLSPRAKILFQISPSFDFDKSSFVGEFGVQMDLGVEKRKHLS